MKVLHVVDELATGGILGTVAPLARFLCARGVDVVVTGRDGDARDDLPASVRTVVAPRATFPTEVARLAALVARERPDVLHAHQRRQALACNVVGRAFGVATVEHAHSMVPRLGYGFLSFRSDRVVAVSPAIAELVVRHFRRDPRRVTVVGNAPGRRGDAPSPPRTPASGRPLVVLGIGKLHAVKDPLRFVRILSELGRARSVVGRWLGDGELRAEVEAVAARLGVRLEVLGVTPEVVRELDAADALVVPSQSEGEPLVVLEAFARACPVVATSVGGLPHLLAEGRGLLVAPEADDVAFARAVERAAAHDTESVARVRRALAFVHEERSEERVYGAILALYTQVARRRR